MAQSSGCVRFDEDGERGGFVATSTIPGNEDAIFYTYEEIFHFGERAKLGLFDGVFDRAREMALKFGAVELTPLNAEHAAPDYRAMADA